MYKPWYFHIFDSTYILKRKFQPQYFLLLRRLEGRGYTGNFDRLYIRSMCNLNLDQSQYRSKFFHIKWKGCCQSFHQLESQHSFRGRGTCRYQFLDQPFAYWLNYQLYYDRDLQKNNILSLFQSQCHYSQHRCSFRLRTVEKHQFPAQHLLSLRVEQEQQ